MNDTTNPTAGEREHMCPGAAYCNVCAGSDPGATPAVAATPDAGDVAWQMLAGVRCQAVHAQIVGAWCVNCESWARTIGEPFWRPSLAALLDAARRAGGDERAEQIAQAIVARKRPTPERGTPGPIERLAYDDAARIARESR